MNYVTITDIHNNMLTVNTYDLIQINYNMKF